MSWDDDDFDVEEDIKAKQKEADEAEMTIDDIQEAKRKKAEAEAAAAPKQKKKPKAKEEEIRPEDCAYDVALEDPVAEKMRRQKLVEEADARMAADLFAGVDKAGSDDEEVAAAQKAKEEAERKAKEVEAAKKKVVKVQIEVHDAFDKLQLATQADVESLLGTCMEKMEDAKVKEAAKMFLTQCIKALVDDLNTDELNNLDKQITGIVKGKKVEQTAKVAGATKSGSVKTKVDKNGNVKETFNKRASYDIAKETADVYGEWGDDWDEEDWADDGTAAQYAPPKAGTAAAAKVAPKKK